MTANRFAARTLVFAVLESPPGEFGMWVIDVSPAFTPEDSAEVGQLTTAIEAVFSTAAKTSLATMCKHVAECVIGLMTSYRVEFVLFDPNYPPTDLPRIAVYEGVHHGQGLPKL